MYIAYLLNAFWFISSIFSKCLARYWMFLIDFYILNTLNYITSGKKCAFYHYRSIRYLGVQEITPFFLHTTG